MEYTSLGDGIFSKSLDYMGLGDGIFSKSLDYTGLGDGIFSSLGSKREVWVLHAMVYAQNLDEETWMRKVGWNS